jgi:hypothetical protein
MVDLSFDLLLLVKWKKTKNIDNVLTIVRVLLNCQIKETPLCFDNLLIKKKKKKLKIKEKINY